MTAPLSGISSMATRLLLTELVGSYEHDHGASVTLESVGGVDAAKRVQDGEPFDFVVLAADAIDRLIAAGAVVDGSRTDLVRSGVAIAVRAGAPRPDVASEESLKRAVLDADSVGYSTGPSGVALVELLERWGIASELGARLVQAPTGIPVGSLVASGEVALGFQQLSELMHLDGLDVLGPMPESVAITTTFSAGVCEAAAESEQARRLIEFMASSQTAVAKRRHGMDPA